MRSTPRADVATVVALGGALGAVARWGLLGATDETLLTTLAINVLGALLLGALVPVAARHPRRPMLRPFLGTGVLGGFTTFSAVQGQTHALATGRPWAAAALTLGTLVAAVAAAWAGARVADALLRPGPMPEPPEPEDVL